MHTLVNKTIPCVYKALANFIIVDFYKSDRFTKYFCLDNQLWMLRANCSDGDQIRLWNLVGSLRLKVLATYELPKEGKC